MNDELSQLLRHTDQQTPPPMLNSTSLPACIRHSAEKQFQRRIATSALATIPILVCFLLVAIQHLHQPQPPLVLADSPSNEDLAMQIAYHQRVADLLEANHPLSTHNPHATDDFLVRLQLERSKAALVLLSVAQNRLRADPPDSRAIDCFRQTIALFPDTPAAMSAQQEIQRLQNSKRQS